MRGNGQIGRIVVAAALVLATLVPAAGAAASIAAPEQQTVAINIGSYPTSLDPSAASSEPDRIVANALFAPLYRSTGTGGSLVPFLAVGQPAVSSDGRTYTVTLRAARWSDGVAITSADVKLGFDRSRTMSRLGKLAATGVTASTVGPRKVRFTLETPSPWFRELLASTATTPVPSKIVKQYGAKWTSVRNIETSGPFEIRAISGRSELDLRRNAMWWGRPGVRLRQLRLVVSAPASATQLFRAGRIDAGMRDTSIPATLMATMRANAGFRTTTSGTAWYLFLNTRSAALQQPATRRALAVAVDRAMIAKQSSGGLDLPLETLVPSSALGFSTIAPEGGSLLKSDGLPQTARARQELLAAGWSATTSLDLWFDATSTAAVAAANGVASGLDAAGVKVVTHPVLPSQLDKVGVGTSPIGDDVELVIRSVAADRADPQLWHSLVTCAAIDGGRNAAMWCDPTTDAAFASATAFAPFASRVASHRALEEQLTGPSGAMPVVPLVEGTADYLVQKWVRGFTMRSTGLVDFEQVYVLDH